MNFGFYLRGSATPLVAQFPRRAWRSMAMAGILVRARSRLVLASRSAADRL